MPRKQNLFGIDIDAVRMNDAVQCLRKWIFNFDKDEEGSQRCRYVVTPNVDHTVLLTENTKLQDSYESADLILADEPTGNLDVTTGEEIVELLFARRAETGATLLIITHDRSLAEKCERVLTMGDGLIVSDTRTDTSSSEAAE